MAAAASVVNPHNVGTVHIMALLVMEFQLRGYKMLSRNTKFQIACPLGVVKPYLWCLGAESQWDDYFGRSKACYDAP